MARHGDPSSSLALTSVFLIILVGAPTPADSFSVSEIRTILSKGHLVMTRVANLRESRGDHAGAERARAIAAALEQGLGLGFLKMTWSAVWDYLRNYAWREMNWMELRGAVSEMKDLLRWVTELTQIESEAKKAAWVGRNYQSILKVFNSVAGKLLRVFRESGALREAVETVKKEVVEGGLLRDGLEVGGNDLLGLMRVLPHLLSGLFPASSPSPSPSPSSHPSDL